MGGDALLGCVGVCVGVGVGVGVGVVGAYMLARFGRWHRIGMG